MCPCCGESGLVYTPYSVHLDPSTGIKLCCKCFAKNCAIYQDDDQEIICGNCIYYGLLHAYDNNANGSCSQCKNHDVDGHEFSFGTTPNELIKAFNTPFIDHSCALNASIIVDRSKGSSQ